MNRLLLLSSSVLAFCLTASAEDTRRRAVPDYEPLALFRTELAENDTPKGVRIDSSAWARGMFGKGRVLISSPHPEQTDGMEGWIVRAVRWAVGR
jgi:hypothetical protein